MGRGAGRKTALWSRKNNFNLLATQIHWRQETFSLNNPPASFSHALAPPEQLTPISQPAPLAYHRSTRANTTLAHCHHFTELSHKIPTPSHLPPPWPQPPKTRSATHSQASFSRNGMRKKRRKKKVKAQTRPRPPHAPPTTCFFSLIPPFSLSPEPRRKRGGAGGGERNPSRGSEALFSSPNAPIPCFPTKNAHHTPPTPPRRPLFVLKSQAIDEIHPFDPAGGGGPLLHALR